MSWEDSIQKASQILKVGRLETKLEIQSKIINALKMTLARMERAKEDDDLQIRIAPTKKEVMENDEALSFDEQLRILIFQRLSNTINNEQRQHFHFLEKCYFLAIFLRDKRAYQLQRNLLQGPGDTCLRDFKRELFDQLDLSDQIFNDPEIGSARQIQRWRRNNCLKSRNSVKGIICVDAIYLLKKSYIDQHGQVQSETVVEHEDGSIEKMAYNSGFAFLFMPISQDLDPILLHFQMHTTGHATDDQVELLRLFTRMASSNNLQICGWSFDADQGYRHLVTEVSEVILNNFKSRFAEVWPFDLIKSIHNYYPIIDISHIAKRFRYRCLKYLINYSGIKEKDCFDFQDLQQILDLKDQDILDDKPNLKQRDDLIHKLYSVQNILKLIANYQEPQMMNVLIHFIIDYPFLSLFVHMDGTMFQKLVIFSCTIMIKLYSFYASLEEWSQDGHLLHPSSDQEARMALPFDQRVLQDSFTSLSQLLELMQKESTIRIFSFGSFGCESFFSQLRYLAHGNDTVVQVHHIINNMEIIKYCETQCNMNELKKSRKTHQTYIWQKERNLLQSELDEIQQLAHYAFLRFTCQQQQNIDAIITPSTMNDDTLIKFILDIVEGVQKDGLIPTEEGNKDFQNYFTGSSCPGRFNRIYASNCTKKQPKAK